MRRAWPRILIGLAVASASPAVGAGDHVEAIPALVDLPEAQLLDVGLDLFDAGLGDAEPDEMQKKGLRAAVRQSEARYIPIHLRNTLQSTGQWGAVRVVPGGAPGSEVSLVGRVLKSNGKDLELEVRAWDATGRRWFEKTYQERAEPIAYENDRLVAVDPFQSLYNRIANDLLHARLKLRQRDLDHVRQVASLRFAADLAPDPFAAYLVADKKGRYRLERLPATDDPLLARVASIRDRDHMFVDTLNEYYGDFYARMDKPYDDWRAYSYHEQLAYDAIRKESLLKKIFGAAAIIGAILMDPQSDMKDVMIIGGVAAIQSGFEDGKELGIHKAALTELADSFEGEVTPLLVDIDGKIVQLKGSAEAQYQQWRELLREIATTDATLPEDIHLLPPPLVVSSEGGGHP
jgi:hypothetical protein